MNLKPQFIPMSREEMNQLGWQELDILLVTGDAYVDHPAFGMALIGRLLLDHGWRVGIIAQPDWKNPDSVKVMGRPHRLRDHCRKYGFDGLHLYRRTASAQR